MTKHIIITSCTKNKCTDFKPERHRVSPDEYLSCPGSVELLTRTRSSIFGLPESAYDVNATECYAYDLYVRDQKTQLYRALRNCDLDVPVRERVLAGEKAVEWYFLSGGYGLLHALELARPYQATFTASIAGKNNIPHTLRTGSRSFLTSWTRSLRRPG